MILLTGYSGVSDKSTARKQIVKPDQLKEWVSFLASDQMRGRANGSPEMKIAAEWIAEQFKDNDLKPADSIGGYFQNYSYTTRERIIKERNVIPQKTSYTIRERTVNERNVVGFIRGTDPSLKNEYLILSAHFDHIGIRKGSQPDSINNGADDNAAGTCTLIGIARTIKKKGLKPGRSIIFAAFSGEENGMRGSGYFVANPCIPLKNIYADMNFEMTGHSGYLGKNKYYMTGCHNSNLDDLIGEYNKKTQFQLVDTISIAEQLFFASDNIAFSRLSATDGITKGIPSGTFATTAIAEYLHKPTDETELFDFDNMAGLVAHFSSLIIWLSKNTTEIAWTDPKFVRP